ncbi:hypothetical protein CC1G_14877 [Coprinopsis cinerea okayama7|uniref:Uncharacterized protein n=1 Tax=Coprinopsis cinerea (strain Okayama-7 / 130 / ATCC MYA-4618 / FGSC 9003) TaxID=240176 RepID=D6RNJ0_COPC7|nr:hypothetical protein CC1G_14877 [Coprinopsis cinerea okayama7\|eukprot:XP_002910900.1 hypothetical protein CC1G_14877 [Coprinopsis cinerea okayama7\
MRTQEKEKQRTMMRVMMLIKMDDERGKMMDAKKEQKTKKRKTIMVPESVCGMVDKMQLDDGNRM